MKQRLNQNLIDNSKQIDLAETMKKCCINTLDKMDTNHFFSFDNGGNVEGITINYKDLGNDSVEFLTRLRNNSEIMRFNLKKETTIILKGIKSINYEQKEILINLKPNIWLLLKKIPNVIYIIILFSAGFLYVLKEFPNAITKYLT